MIVYLQFVGLSYIEIKENKDSTIDFNFLLKLNSLKSIHVIANKKKENLLGFVLDLFERLTQLDSVHFKFIDQLIQIEPNDKEYKLIYKGSKSFQLRFNKINDLLTCCNLLRTDMSKK